MGNEYLGYSDDFRRQLVGYYQSGQKSKMAIFPFGKMLV